MASYSDNLDGTGGALLSSRSGWSRTAGSDDATLATGGSGYHLTTGSTNADGTWHVPTSQPSGNDQYAEAIIQLASAGNPWPLGVRCDTTISLGGGYLVALDTSTRVRIFRRPVGGGASTVIGSYTHGNSTDFATNKVRLEAVGTTISLTFMGSVRISVTDTTFSSGSVGMLSRGGTASTTISVDEIEWGDVSVAGAIAGSTAPAFTASGTMQATGALSGAASIAATASGALAATGALAGAGAASFTGSGAIAATGALSGSTSPAFTGSGTLYNASAPAGAMSGTATVAASAGGTIAGAGSLAGTSAVAVSASGAGTATAFLSGASSLAFVASGAVGGFSPLSGAASVNVSGLGIVRGSGALMGTGGVTFSASATAAGNENEGPRFATASRPFLGQSRSRPVARSVW